MIRLFIAMACMVATCTYAASDGWMPESRFGPKGKSVTTFIDAAEAAEQKKNYKQARKFYAQVEKNTINTKNKGRAISMQGVCYAEEGKPWAAFKKYEKTLDNYAGQIPFFDDILMREFNLAEDFYNGKKNKFLFFSLSSEDMAQRIYDHVVKVAPYSDVAPKALYRSALISINLNNAEGGIEKLRRVRSRYPKSEVTADARLSLAEALLAAAAKADGDGSLVREANRELSRFVDRYPDHPKMARAEELRIQSREQEASRLLALGEFYLRPAHDRQTAARGYLRDVTANFPDTVAATQAELLLAGLSADADAGTVPAPAPAPVPKKATPSAATSAPKASGATTPVATAPISTTKVVVKPAAPVATEPEPPLQSGEGRFLRPIENLKEYR